MHSQEKPGQAVDVTIKDLDRHVMARPAEEEGDMVVPVAVIEEKNEARRPTSTQTPEATSDTKVTSEAVVRTDKETSATTVKQTTNAVIQYTTKDPPVFCDITNGDAVSAISRASTVACKNMIKNVTCLAQEGKLYDMNIPNLCSLGTNPGVVVESLSFSTDPSSSVRVLFLMSLHGRSVRQVKRLFKAIYHSSHYYYIHVDSVKL